MKVFGKDLFDYKKPTEPMYDFAQHGVVSVNNGFINDFVVFDNGASTGASTTGTTGLTTSKIVIKKEKPNKKTPKEVFETKALNNNNFSIQTDEAYLVDQIQQIKDKLSLIAKAPKQKKNEPQLFEMGGIKYGRQELESILKRLQNRRRISEFKAILDKYPHTSNALVADVITEHSHLRCQKADEFVPDMPREAIASMKEYNEMCKKLCNETAVFYVIADETDFQVKNKRRDPILLAQSPFGFFWQILGAWDKEMIYLGDL